MMILKDILSYIFEQSMKGMEFNMKDSKIKILSKLIEDSNNIVFFGGAGVSTESRNT